MWYPGATPPEHLDGSLPGDYGFDPFNLGTQPDAMKWFREAELYNGRVAMFAVPGMLLPEAFGGSSWDLAGAKVDSPLPLGTLVAVELAVWAIFEYKRYENYKKVGTTGLLGFAPFDPLGMMSEWNACGEVKNGRLAMLAFLGILVQTFVQQKGPIACLQAHLADPIHNNLYTTWLAPGFLVYTMVLAIIPFFQELSQQTFGRTKEEIYGSNVFFDTWYKRSFNYGIALAPFMAAAYIEQVCAGYEAYHP